MGIYNKSLTLKTWVFGCNGDYFDYRVLMVWFIWLFHILSHYYILSRRIEFMANLSNFLFHCSTFTFSSVGEIYFLTVDSVCPQEKPVCIGDDKTWTKTSGATSWCSREEAEANATEYIVCKIVSFRCIPARRWTQVGVARYLRGYSEDDCSARR